MQFSYETNIFSNIDYCICDDEFNNWIKEATKINGVTVEIISSNMFCSPDPKNDNIPTFYIYVLYKEISND